MPEENPTPITPEGKRAADRMRSIFFMIAAANIVIVAIVIWQRHAQESRRDATPARPAAVEYARPPATDGAPNRNERSEKP